MGDRKSIRLALLPGMLLVSLALGGCKAAAHGAGSATAPTLANGDTSPARRNVADPNAPFVVKGARPVLTIREPILDVNGVPPCAPEQLTAFESGAQTTGQNHSLRMSLLNRQQACRLGGFPSVSLIDPHGEVLGSLQLERVSHDTIVASLQSATQTASLATDEDTAPSPQVLMAARGEADFEIGWTSGSGCPQVARIAVAAPGTTESILVGRILQVCGNKLLITAVSPPEAFQH